MIAKILGLVIFIAIAITVFTTVQSQITGVTTTMNVTNESTTAILQATPFFFAMAILMVVIAMIASFFKFNLPDVTENQDLEENEEKKYKKQTYLEYVKERIEIEKLMRKN